jgi:hypothetical protein
MPAQFSVQEIIREKPGCRKGVIPILRKRVNKTYRRLVSESKDK